MSNPIRSLPPGVDSIDGDIVFGSMWIKIGTLKLIRTSNAQYKVICQFWGEETPAILAVRSDTPNNQQQRTQRYDIKCPVTYFAEYLQQMKKNLRLEVADVGKVSINILKYMNKTVCIDSTKVFEHFKGFFEVIGSGNRIAGSLQIEMDCVFDPKIAVRELGQQKVQQMRKSHIQNCPAQSLQVKQCCGHCPCVCPQIALPKLLPLSVQKSNMQKNNYPNNDPRIAHSLETKTRLQNQYVADKYLLNQVDVQIPKTQTNKIQQIKQQVKNKQQLNLKLQKSQQFPQVPKILTYSNLRLNYDDPEFKQELNKAQQNQNQNLFRKKQSISKSQQEEVITINKQEEKYTNKNQFKPVYNIGESVEDPHYEIKAKPEISKEDLMKQFYGAAGQPIMKQNIEVNQQKSDTYFYKNSRLKEQSEKDKLSRVVDLDKQLERPAKIERPPQLPFMEQSAKFYDMNIRNQARPSKSGLMLNLFIEIPKKSINIPTKEGFIIAYRPYGQKQRLTIGPDFGDLISITSIVGENEVKKMGKTPFIIEFWGAVHNKFLGLIKIDLKMIKQGFLLQDRLNEIAIKTNILPTTIQRGDSKIIDLADALVGSCWMFAGIGTSNQLNTYLNQKESTALPTYDNKKIISKQSKIQDPQKQIPEKQERAIDSKSIMSNYDTFLDHLYKNNNKIIDKLNEHMDKKYTSRHQFNELGKLIELHSLNPIYNLHDKIQDRKTDIDFHKIAQSFDDFIQIMQQVKNDFAVCSKSLRNIFSDPIAVLGKVKEQSPMRMISKRKAISIMSRYSRFAHPINEYFDKLNQYISLDLLQSCMTGKTASTPQLSQISKEYLNQIVSERVCSKLMGEGFSIKQLHQFAAGKKVLPVVQFYKWLNSQAFSVSLWAILHWAQFITASIQQSDVENVYLDLVLQYFQLLNDQLNIKKQVIDIPNPHVEPQTIPKQPSQQQNIQRPPSQPQIIIPNSININTSQEQSPEEQKQPEKPSILVPQNESNIAGKQENKNQPTFYKHLFSIQPTQLSLDHPIKGNCVVTYSFPFDEDQIKSKNFVTTVDKHKYPLKMYGTHGFSIQEPAQNYLGDNSLKFFVIIDKKIEYEGALPSDELLIKPNTEEDKIIPLFSERNEGIAGKIRLNIQYEQALASENTLGKQTTYQLFLPKTGYINYAITCQLQPSKIRTQLNIRQQFYMALALDIFYHNSNLRTMIPPCSSKLYSDSSEIAELTGSIKTSLSPVVLQYLKSSSARLSLNVIYYSKDTGNFERKQVPYAIIELPMMNVIKNQGIKGDYAFKNKLGMFVTLANCSIKYDKDPISKTVAKSQPQKLGIAYWVIFNFLEFLNFDVSKYNWIKMEFVLKGRKYSTEKQLLQPYSINALNNAGIMLKFNEEDFADTKIIPVTILTNLSQKFAIDINLKAMSRQLTHKKYAINNQYYVIVNQQSRPTKMRLSMKTYCFRGGPLLSNFVNSLYQHLDLQIFQQMELPQQMDNYEQMLNILKNRLKLTSKGLHEALTELDPHKNKDKLNFQFFTNRTYYKLDFTPILAESESDIDFICQQLPTEANKQQVLDYLINNKIKLQNFRPQFLDRFYFKQLNKAKTDKNVEFLCIQDRIDLISFVRKIKILDGSSQYEQSYLKNQTMIEQKYLEMTILEGQNFQFLYSGIKPNSIIRIPQLGFQTQVSHRNSNPYFNQQFQYQLHKQNSYLLKKLKIEVFHCSVDDDDAENIIIGEGFISINPIELKGSNKIIKVTLNSLMSKSNKMKASVNIRVGLSQMNKSHHKEESSQKNEESADVSRFGDIIHDIKQEMANKNRLFESSDQDDF